MKLASSVGFTVIVYVDGGPTQVVNVAVTVIVAVIAVMPGLVATKPAMFPVPLDPNPIAVLSFVHAKVPPPGVLTKFVAATAPLLHTTTFAGTVTAGEEFTVIV